MTAIRGRRALVTGAASGIGRAFARELARAGAALLLVDVNAAGLEDAARETRALGAETATHACDLADAAAVEALAAQALSHPRGVELLLNVAGVLHVGDVDAMSASEVERLLAVNLLAPVRLTQRLLPGLIERRGHVLNLCSVAGLVATRRLALYSTSKFGLVGYSENLRSECGRRLGVTAVCPGIVDTPMMAAGLESDEQARRLRRIPLLVTTPEAVARRGVRAIERDRALVLVTPLAHVAWWLKRLSPRLVRRY